jgi:hypothetical protein
MRLSVPVCVLVPDDAVTVTRTGLATGPLVTRKFTLVEPEGTVTLGGT